jgi:hypothetical protein
MDEAQEQPDDRCPVCNRDRDDLCGLCADGREQDLTDRLNRSRHDSEDF